MTEYCPWFIIQLPVPKNHFFKIFWKVWSIYFKISWKYWRNVCRVMSLSRSNLQPHNSVLSLAKWLNTSTVVTMSYWSSKSFLFGDRKYAKLWLKIWTCNIYYCVCSTEKAFLPRFSINSDVNSFRITRRSWKICCPISDVIYW